MENPNILLENYIKKKYGETDSNGPFKIDLGEIDFVIPALHGSTVESFKALQKHNAKHKIFGD